MSRGRIPNPVPWLVVVMALTVLVLWLGGALREREIAPRLPGADRGAAAGTPQPKPVDLRGTLTRLSGTPGALPGAWPRFRGAVFDNIARPSAALAVSWPSNAPPTRWTAHLGDGYAGAAVLNGCVYVLDYDAQHQADVLKCLSLDDGQIIWQRSYSVEVKRNHGMSRTIPAVTDKYVLTLGPKCHVVCVDAKSGEFLWGIDLVRQFNAIVPPWYAGQCPIIDDDKAIIAPGGDALMIAIDCGTGRVIWKTANPLGWQMTHSSIMPMTIGGRKTYVYCGSGGVAGVSADDGQVLWTCTDWKVSMATVPSPLIIDENRVFLSGGYGAGAMMLRLAATPGGIVATSEYRLKPEVFGAEQQTPIYYQGHIYGVIPSGQLVCLSLEGRPLWTSGSRRFGLGAYLLGDGKIFVLNDHGVLFVVSAEASVYRELGHAELIPDGHESWGPLALAGTRLLARDLTRMVCVDLKEPGND
jgi:outer membrane protein assembly factor BamB